METNQKQLTKKCIAMTKRQLIQQALFYAKNPPEPENFHPEDLAWLQDHGFNLDKYREYGSAIIIKEHEQEKSESIVRRYDRPDKRVLVVCIMEKKPTDEN